MKRKACLAASEKSVGNDLQHKRVIFRCEGKQDGFSYYIKPADKFLPAGCSLPLVARYRISICSKWVLMQCPDKHIGARCPLAATILLTRSSGSGYYTAAQDPMAERLYTSLPPGDAVKETTGPDLGKTDNQPGSIVEICCTLLFCKRKKHRNFRWSRSDKPSKPFALSQVCTGFLFTGSAVTKKVRTILQQDQNCQAKATCCVSYWC